VACGQELSADDMIHLVTFKKLKAEETGGWMSNLLSVGRGEPDELVELRQEALQVEGRLVLLDSILFSHWCRSLFSPQEARIHHHCFESNVVKHFGLDALHPLSHERQGRTSKLQELHHFVFFCLCHPLQMHLHRFTLAAKELDA